jgi:hypothetical protein
MDLNNSEIVEAAIVAGGVEELLADLDMDLSGGDGDGDVVEEVIEALSPGALAAIEIVGAVGDAYIEQPVTTGNIEAPAPAAAKEKKVRKASTKVAGTPRATKDLSAIDAGVFVLEDMAVAVIGLEANKLAVLAAVPKQKKVAEKFENVIRSLSVNKRPSVYVMACFDVLQASATGEATSSDLVGALKAASSRSGSGYSQGTAAAQTGQIMVLFDHLKIAKRDGQKLTLDRDAPMTKRLAALPAAV